MNVSLPAEEHGTAVEKNRQGARWPVIASLVLRLARHDGERLVL